MFLVGVNGREWAGRVVDVVMDVVAFLMNILVWVAVIGLAVFSMWTLTQ